MAHSTAEFPSHFSTFVTFSISAVVALLIIYLITFKKSLNFVNIDGNKKHKAIPVYSSSTLGFRLPLFFETVIMFAQIRKEGVKLLETIFQEHSNNPIVKVPAMTSHVLQINCPILIQKILGSSSTSFLSKPQHFTKYVLPPMFRKGILNVEQEVWSPHRKLINKKFYYRTSQSFTGITNSNVNNLISSLLREISRSNSEIIDSENLYEAIYFNIFNIISKILMGDDTFTHEENASFRFHYLQAKSHIVHRLLNPHNLFPFVWYFNPQKKDLEFHLSKLRDHVQSAISKRKEKLLNRFQQQQQKQSSHSEIPDKPETDEDNSNSSAIFRSLIDELLPNMPEENIESEVMIFLLAGHETTAGTIKYFLQHIAEYPEIQRLCQEEVDSMFESKTQISLSSEGGLVDLTMADLANLKYLERCIQETLRITPVSPFMLRQLDSNVELEGYGRFQKDEVLLVPIWALHRNPESYPEPEKFDPDRFLPENVGKRKTCSYLPFSYGPRNCIGYKVAMMEMKIILGSLLRYFDISTGDRLQDLKINFDFTTTPEREYNVTLTKRQPRL